MRLATLAIAVVLPQILNAQIAPVIGTDGSFLQIDRAEQVLPRVAESCPSSGPDLRRQQDSLVLEMGRPHDGTAEQWLAIACTRALLMSSGAFTLTAEGVSLGESWHSSAMEAAERALRLEPADRNAARMVAMLAAPGGWLQRFGAPEQERRVLGIPRSDPVRTTAMLARAVRLGVHDSLVFRVCVSQAIHVGDFVTARDCAIRGLDAGADSTWHLLRLSAIAFWGADTVRGMDAFRAAVLASSSAESRAELGWHLETGFKWHKTCAPCYPNGIINMVGTSTWLPSNGLLADDRKMEFLGLPVDSVLPWIEREAGRFEFYDLSCRGCFAMTSSPSPLYEVVWDSAGPLTKRVFRHFHYTSYASGTFRSCLRWFPLPKPPCMPRRTFVPGTYVEAGFNALNLWNQEGLPVTYAAWAVSADDVEEHVPVAIHVRRWGLQGGTLWDTTAAVAYRRSEGSKARTLLGLIAMPASPAPTIGLVVAQGDRRRGGYFRDDLTPLGTGPVELSDVILSRPGFGVRLPVDSAEIYLPPIPVFEAREPIALYFQINNRGVADSLTLHWRVLARSPLTGRFSDPKVALSYGVEFGAGITGFTRELGLAELKDGAYRLESWLTDAGVQVGTSRGATFVIE